MIKSIPIFIFHTQKSIYSLHNENSGTSENGGPSEFLEVHLHSGTKDKASIMPLPRFQSMVNGSLGEGPQHPLHSFGAQGFLGAAGSFFRRFLTSGFPSAFFAFFAFALNPILPTVSLFRCGKIGGTTSSRKRFHRFDVSSNLSFFN